LKNRKIVTNRENHRKTQKNRENTKITKNQKKNRRIGEGTVGSRRFKGLVLKNRKIVTNHRKTQKIVKTQKSQKIKRRIGGLERELLEVGGSRDSFWKNRKIVKITENREKSQNKNESEDWRRNCWGSAVQGTCFGCVGKNRKNREKS